jgi:outer membrane receptor protein involved in Fe transport
MYISSERFLLFIVAIIICYMPHSLSAQSNNELKIYGIVLDECNGEVISSVQITLESKNKELISKTKTNFLGKYEFKNLTGGLYKITFLRLGYKTKILDLFLSVENNSPLTITLTPIEIEIEKINVTATKTEQTLQKTPSSINLISGDEISQKNKFTFDEVLADVQGITINRTSGINVSSLSIRGSSDVAGGGIGNRVLLLLDGRPSLTGDSKGALWSLIPISIIDKVEVVKGAFSSLYGSSAIGGVVNVITKKPSYKPYFSLGLNYGFYQKLSDSLKFSNKLQSLKGIDVIHSNTMNKFSYLLAFDYKQNDGYSQQSNFNLYSGLAKLTYDLFSNRDIEFTFQYTNSECGYPHYWRKDAGQIAQPYMIAPYYIGDKINKETQSYDLLYRSIPGSKSKFSSRFYYYKLYSVSDYNSNNPVSYQYGTPGQNFKTNITSYNFGNINQMDYEINTSNYLIAGTDIQWNVVRSAPASILYGDQQQNNFAVYFQDEWKLVKSKNDNAIFSSTFGGRIDYSNSIGTMSTVQISPKFSLLFVPQTSSGVLENTSYRILLGRAFRTPSIAEFYFKKELFGGFDFIYNPNLKPETMFSLEVGIRKQYKTRLTLDVSAYFNLYDNLIQYVNIGDAINGPFQVQNIAKSQVRGIEFLIDYTSSFRIFDEIFKYKFEFNYNYNDARDLSVNRLDDLLPYKPKHNFNFGMNLDYFGFDLNVSRKYLSKVEKVIFYKYEEPDAYFLMNIKLSKNIGNHINVFVAVNNVFDKFYQELERITAPNRSYNSGINIEF